MHARKNLLAYIFEVRAPKASRKVAKKMPVKALRGSHSTAAHLQAASTAHTMTSCLEAYQGRSALEKKFWQTIEVVGSRPPACMLPG
jgi:hypothetical protein